MRSVRSGLVVGAALLALSACGSSAAATGGPLRGDGAGYGTSVVTVPNRPYTMGGLLLCTNGAAFVLDSVRAAAVHGSGKLEDAGVRSSPPEDGAIDGGQGVLPAVMGPVKGYRVTRVCDSPATTVSELGIQVSRGHGYGEVDGLRINYHVGNTAYESLYKFTATLCDPAANDNPRYCSD
jgi:hypothetical protein